MSPEAERVYQLAVYCTQEKSGLSRLQEAVALADIFPLDEAQGQGRERAPGGGLCPKFSGSSASLSATSLLYNISCAAEDQSHHVSNGRGYIDSAHAIASYTCW